jgi:alkylation response protein AidB-like acyl-CoA dehydrogenase
VGNPAASEPAPGDGTAAFRSETRAALAARLQPRSDEARSSVLGAGNDDLAAGRAYLQALANTGFAVPTWPIEHGGLGASAAETAVVNQELAHFDVPDLYPYLVALALVGPVLVAYGTPAQQARWLPLIKNGEEIWCQLFSEPNAGSDLANLSTRAARDGDSWIVDGQKVWTSRGAYSRRGLLLARSDTARPKHDGITAFGIDMHTSGVEVRPLRQMNGDAHFSEVFLSGVRVPDDDRIGEVGDGWRVALTTLAHERGAVGSPGGSFLDVERLLALVRRRGVIDDPARRDALVRAIVDVRVAGLTARRARDTARAGRPGPAGSGLKLRSSAAFKRYVEVAMQALGADGMLDPDGEWQTLFLTAPSLSIRGGTDEIQRNIVGERVLGLPGEPRVDRGVPFNELLH